MSASAIKQALDSVIDPELLRPITELGMVEFDEKLVTVKLTVAGCPAAVKIENDVRTAVSSFDVDVAMSVMTQAERDELKLKLRGGRPPRQNPFDQSSLTKIFLISSGKGGVGKSTLTANLAVELASQNFKVGIIDADIFGFSIPGQLGMTDRPTKVDDMILPPVINGIKVISIAMFLDVNKAVAWRGPMLHRTIEQFICDVYWGDLDFLLVDMPPGTGDIAISVGQQLPTAKTIVVTTPQFAAADVAERSGEVGLKTGQKIFGVIENMSWLVQADGSKLEIFGSGGGRLVAERLSKLNQEDVPLLGQIPISVALRQAADDGSPLAGSDSSDAAATAIAQIAKKMIESKLDLAGKKLKVNL
ncbi:MAG: P-loop NTPase [Rhodoluna sp.]